MSNVSRTATPKWKWRRREAIIRDEYTCQECGKLGAYKGNAKLHVHHIEPVSDGGSDDLENLETLCSICHMQRHRGTSRPETDPDRFRVRLVTTLYRHSRRCSDSIEVPYEVASQMGQPKDSDGHCTDLVREVAAESDSPIEQTEAGITLQGSVDAICSYLHKYTVEEDRQYLPSKLQT